MGVEWDDGVPKPPRWVDAIILVVALVALVYLATLPPF